MSRSVIVGEAPGGLILALAASRCAGADKYWMKNTEKLRDKIAQAFTCSMGDPEAAREIAFHMTDWDHNVDELVKLYEHPESFSHDEVLNIIQFLAHVPNNVAAAKKLARFGPIEDIFKVGVLKEDEE